jgi:hypothetical protein
MKRYIIISFEGGDQFVTTSLKDKTVIEYTDGKVSIDRVALIETEEETDKGEMKQINWLTEL